MYLKIVALERIDTNVPAELFTASDANGIAVCIKQIELYNDDGTINRTCKLNDAMLKLLKDAKIPV